jgi:hypothetical protein
MRLPFFRDVSGTLLALCPLFKLETSISFRGRARTYISPGPRKDRSVVGVPFCKYVSQVDLWSWNHWPLTYVHFRHWVQWWPHGQTITMMLSISTVPQSQSTHQQTWFPENHPHFPRANQAMPSSQNTMYFEPWHGVCLSTIYGQLMTTNVLSLLLPFLMPGYWRKWTTFRSVNVKNTAAAPVIPIYERLSSKAQPSVLSS